MTYFADRYRHLVSDDPNQSLEDVAEAFEIERHWLHRDHVDIPKRQILRVLTDPRVTVVRPRDIARIARKLHEPQ